MQRGLGTWHDIYPYFIVSDGFSTRIQNGWPLYTNIKYVIHQGIYHIKMLSKGKTCIRGLHIYSNTHTDLSFLFLIFDEGVVALILMG